MVLREFASGVGFVDVGISFNGPLHLIELKVLKGQLLGARQLGQYMRLEARKVGWLLLIDARRAGRRAAIPSVIKVPEGVIRTVVVDVNPVPPHLA
jgi:hypothetical protein